jgi:hypothetical protein
LNLAHARLLPQQRFGPVARAEQVDRRAKALTQASQHRCQQHHVAECTKAHDQDTIDVAGAHGRVMSH